MKRAKVTWIGNPHKKELHRVEEGKKPKGCQLPEVKSRLEFSTAKAGRDFGYDACAYCTKKFKSKK